MKLFIVVKGALADEGAELDPPSRGVGGWPSTQLVVLYDCGHDQLKSIAKTSSLEHCHT